MFAGSIRYIQHMLQYKKLEEVRSQEEVPLSWVLTEWKSAEGS